MIPAYFANIKAVVDKYAAANFVLDAQLNLESRPGEQGYLSGALIFVDGSTLHFAEFLDAAGETVDKLMYTYHYQDSDAHLIFRYDNARHRSPLQSQEHKHVLQQVVVALAPTLENVLTEIAHSQGWV